MKKLSRKLLVSSLSLAFATVALGTTTFAWFTSNATATATLDVNVQSGTTGILLSTNGKDFKSELEASDFNVSTVVLNPVHQVGDSDGLDFKGLAADGTATATTTGNEVLVFDIYVLTNGDGDVFFSKTGNTVTQKSVGDPYTILNTFEYKVGTDSYKLLGGTSIKVNAANAMRSTFGVSADTATREEVVQKAKASLTAVNTMLGTMSYATDVVGFDDGIDYAGTADGTQSDDLAYNFGQDLNVENAANSYLNTIKAGTVAASGTETFKGSDTTNGFDSSVDGYNAVADKVFIGVAGKVKRLTFYYWLEGYDADCFDAITNNQVLTINLSLTTSRGE